MSVDRIMPNNEIKTKVLSSIQFQTHHCSRIPKKSQFVTLKKKHKKHENNPKLINDKNTSS